MSTPIILMHQSKIEAEGLDPAIPEYVYRAVISEVLWRQCLSQSQSKNEELENTFVPISGAHLRTIHWQAVSAIKYMCDAGYMVRTNYVVGEKCYEYKFTEKYWSKPELYYIQPGDIHGSAFKSFVKRLSGSKYEVLDDSDWLRRLAHWSMSIEVDPSGFAEADGSGRKALQDLVNVNNKRWHFTNSTPDGRVYTNFSLMPKDYCRYIVLAGESDLVQLDLSCSNYYFLAAEFLSDLERAGGPDWNTLNTHSRAGTSLYDSGFSGGALHIYRSSDFRIAGGMATSSDFILEGYELERNGELEADSPPAYAEERAAGINALISSTITSPSLYDSGFLASCFDGTFYELLQDEAEQVHGKRPNRDQAKLWAQIILNRSTEELLSRTYDITYEDKADRKQPVKSIAVSNENMRALYLALREKYPSVFSWVEVQKRYCDYHGIESLGVYLMQKESSLMIRQVARRVVELGLGPILTKHDAIVAPRARIAQIKELVELEALRTYVEPPAMKIEEL